LVQLENPFAKAKVLQKPSERREFEMCVRIDEARQKRCIPEIDNIGFLKSSRCHGAFAAPDIDYPLTVDDQRAIGNNPSGNRQNPCGTVNLHSSVAIAPLEPARSNIRCSLKVDSCPNSAFQCSKPDPTGRRRWYCALPPNLRSIAARPTGSRRARTAQVRLEP